MIEGLWRNLSNQIHHPVNSYTLHSYKMLQVYNLAHIPIQTEPVKISSIINKTKPHRLRIYIHIYIYIPRFGSETNLPSPKKYWNLEQNLSEPITYHRFMLAVRPQVVKMKILPLINSVRFFFWYQKRNEILLSSEKEAKYLKKHARKAWKTSYLFIVYPSILMVDRMRSEGHGPMASPIPPSKSLHHRPASPFFPGNLSMDRKYEEKHLLVVVEPTHLKNISEIGSFLQVVYRGEN